MALKYQTLSLTNQSLGIDQKSSPNAIPDGFCEDIKNADVDPRGFIKKRKGYQGYYGYVPLRVFQIDYTGTAITLTLDSSIDLTGTSGSPIVVYGKTTSAHATGDFTSTAGADYYTTFSVSTNTIILTGSDVGGGNNYSDTTPQMTVWGISHDSIYSSSNKGGYVCHLDRFSQLGTERLVCGLGGCFYVAKTRAEEGTDYKIPTTTVSKTNTVNGAQNIGPVFYTTGSVGTRDAGTVAGGNIASNLAVVTDVAFVSANSLKYTLRITNIAGTLAGAIVTTGVVGDEAVVTGCAYAEYNGTFRITAVSDITHGDGTTGIGTITVNNTYALTDDFDQSDMDGRLGIFTDRVTTASSPGFLASDEIISSEFTDTITAVVVYNTSGASMVIRGVDDNVALSNTDNIHIRRTTDEVPVADEVNFVIGDMCSFTGISREVRVTAIDTTNNILTIDESMEVDHGDTIAVVGRWIPIEPPSSNDNKVRVYDTDDYDNQEQVRSVMIKDNMYFTNYSDEVYKFDGTNIYRAGLPRWQPQYLAIIKDNEVKGAITASSVSTTLSADDSVTGVTCDDGTETFTKIGHGIADDTPIFIDSSLVEFTIDSEVVDANECIVYVRDYAANTFKVCAEPGGTALNITTDDGAATFTVYPLINQITVTDSSLFTIGDVIGFDFVEASPERRAFLDYIYEITAIDDYNKKLTVNPFLPAVNGHTITKIRRMKYYFRYYAIDANDNINVSPCTGLFDYSIDVRNKDAKVYFKLIGFPKWDIYDYTNLKLHVYKAFEPSNSYKLLTSVSNEIDHTLFKTFDYIDSHDEATLRNQDEVAVVVGAQKELNVPDYGTQWTAPVLAKYITTLDNRMILANLKGFPEIDLELRPDPNVSPEDIDDVTLLFKKDSTDGTATSDIVNRLKLKFIGSISGYEPDYDLDALKLINTVEVISTDYLMFNFSNSYYTGGNIVSGAWVQLIRSKYTSSDDKQHYITEWFPMGRYPNNQAAATHFVVYSKAHGYTGTLTVNLCHSLVIPTSSGAITDYTVPVFTAVDRNREWVKGKGPYDPFAAPEMSSEADWSFHAMQRTSECINTVMRNTDPDMYDFLGFDQDYITTGTPGHITWNGHGLSEGDAVVFYKNAAGTFPTTTPGSAFTHGSTYYAHVVDANTFRLYTSSVDDIQLDAAGTFKGVLRLANQPYSGFTPWLTAHGGSEIGYGKLLVNQPRVDSTTFSCIISGDVTDPTTSEIQGIWFSQGVERSSGDSNLTITAQQRVYPSRVAASFQNYPELFEGIDSANPTEFKFVYDINPSDGQEIRGAIPFFGESVFGGGQKEGLLVIFKEYSAYLLDIFTGKYQKLETRGQGCIAPYAVTQTKNGIIFVNKTGIYRLNRDLSIDNIGENLGRYWEDTVNRDELATSFGHNYSYGSKYKLSVPVDSDTANSVVLVYDYETEKDRRHRYGAWTRYDSHDATCWCNMGKDSFFGTTNGQIFKIRNNSEAQDYRDDASAVSDMEIKTKVFDFNSPGVQKAFSSVVVHYHLRNTSLDDTDVQAAMDYSTTFTTLGTTDVTSGSSSMKSIRLSLPYRRGEAVQVKFLDSTIDQDLVVAGVDFRVGGLDDRGIVDSDQST